MAIFSGQFYSMLKRNVNGRYVVNPDWVKRQSEKNLDMANIRRYKRFYFLINLFHTICLTGRQFSRIQFVRYRWLRVHRFQSAEGCLCFPVRVL